VTDEQIELAYRRIAAHFGVPYEAIIEIAATPQETAGARAHGAIAWIGVVASAKLAKMKSQTWSAFVNEHAPRFPHLVHRHGKRWRFASREAVRGFILAASGASAPAIPIAPRPRAQVKVPARPAGRGLVRGDKLGGRHKL
jgi:hypothetical protein